MFVSGSRSALSTAICLVSEEIAHYFPRLVSHFTLATEVFLLRSMLRDRQAFGLRAQLWVMALMAGMRGMRVTHFEDTRYLT